MHMQLGQIRTIIGSICVDDCHYCLLTTYKYHSKIGFSPLSCPRRPEYF